MLSSGPRNMAERCIFCPTTTAKRTGEHIWSDWINKELTTTGFTLAGASADGKPRTWRDSKLRVKANVVCERCNNGWMSQLEQRSKPILSGMIRDGSRVTLQPADLAVIACVAYKNAIVASEVGGGGFFSFRERARHLFAKKLTIPGGVQMWLARLPHQGFGLCSSDIINTAPDYSNPFDLNVFNYAAGHLLIQVLAFAWRDRAKRRHGRPAVLTQNKGRNSYSIQFWPIDGAALLWPPPQDVSYKLLHEEFRYRWMNVKHRS